MQSPIRPGQAQDGHTAAGTPPTTAILHVRLDSARRLAPQATARKWLNTNGVAHYWDMAMTQHTAEQAEVA